MKNTFLNNTIGLAGSWLTTALTALSDTVGVEVTDMGTVDIISIISGLAAAYLTISLATIRMAQAREKRAEAMKKEQEAKKMEQEVKAMEIDNKIKLAEANRLGQSEDTKNTCNE